MNMVLLKNGRVINDDCVGFSSPQDILIENNKIQKVAKDITVTSNNVEIIDLHNQFVLPGLIDAHIHVSSPILSLSTDECAETYIGIFAKVELEKMLRRGFTSIRDAGGELHGIAKAAKDGLIKGPRLFYSGRAISQTGGHGDFRTRSAPFMPCGCCHSGSIISRIADGVSEVRKAVRDEFRKGATQIKVMASGGVTSPNDSIYDTQFSIEELRAIVEECDAKGSYVMAHVFTPEGIRRCVDAGIRTIEHGFLLNEEAANHMAKHEVFLVPTFCIMDSISRFGQSEGISDDSLSKLNAIKDQAKLSVKFAKEAGVKIGLGSDVWGSALSRQANELLLRAELESASDVIRSATQVNADLLQKKDELGYIKEGYLADIIVLAENPVEDISVLTNNNNQITLVVSDGEVVK